MQAAAFKFTYVSPTDEALATAVLALIAATFASLVIAHIVDREVSPVRDAVSDFGAREHPWFYRLAAVWLGIAGLLTALMLDGTMLPKPTLTILCLLVFAATRCVITVFPTDLEGEEKTPVGHSHFVLAATAFTAIVLAAATFALAIDDDTFWEQRNVLFVSLASILAVTGLAMAAARRFYPQVFGLIERVFYLCMFAWLGAVAMTVLGW